jgi:hypothetical protein
LLKAGCIPLDAAESISYQQVKECPHLGVLACLERVYGCSPEAITLERIFMNRTCAVAALVIAATCTTASADSPRLKGSYAFTGTAACLVSPGQWDPGVANIPANPNPGVLAPGSGFRPNLQPNDALPSPPNPPQNSFTRSFSVFGIRTFDGHGHGHVSGTAVGIDGRPTPGPNGWPHFPPSAGSGDFSFDFTYAVDGNGGWTSTMVPGSYTESFATGPRAGQTATVDAIPPVTGSISLDGKTLIAAHTVPVVETRTFSNGDVWPEICHRSRVFIKLQDSDDDHDDDHGRDH